MLISEWSLARCLRNHYHALRHHRTPTQARASVRRLIWTIRVMEGRV